MFSLSRCMRSPSLLIKGSQWLLFSKSSRAIPALTATSKQWSGRFFSSSPLPPDDPQTHFKAKPPKALNLEMADGIQTANMLILRHGVGKQRLELLAQDESMPLVLKWQRMMEIYLGAQLHVVAALGYETNENGIMMYTQQLAQFVSKCDPQTQDHFRTIGRETWRAMLATAFNLDEQLLEEKCGEEMSIVDARNTVHKVASRLMEPEILETVAKRCSQLPHESDPQVEMGMKHQIIQDVVVNQAYLGGNSPLVEELGFGMGPKAYAVMQYVMAYHENDPLCMQYTNSAMIKIWKAAGLDFSQSPQAAKIPMSTPQV